MTEAATHPAGGAIAGVLASLDIYPDDAGEAGISFTVTGDQMVALFERAQGAAPHRGDKVAEWLKARRDQTENAGWWALDNALDDYRLHADTGTPLGMDVYEGSER